MKAFINKLAGKLGFRIERVRAYPIDFTDQTIDLAEKVRPYTMTSPKRINALIDAVQYVNRRKIPGCFVECGVWRGGSTMAAAEAFIATGDRDRELFLFDTFEGMPEPGPHDRKWKGDHAAAKFEELRSGADSSHWCEASLEDVQANLEKVDYPAEKLHFIKGKVEDTLPDTEVPEVAILRLDTDWYESTKLELELLFPKLVPGGVLILDDYGSWEGARKAVDEYLEAMEKPILLSRIDRTGRMGVKA